MVENRDITIPYKGIQLIISYKQLNSKLYICPPQNNNCIKLLRKIKQAPALKQVNLSNLEGENFVNVLVWNTHSTFS